MPKKPKFDPKAVGPNGALSPKHSQALPEPKRLEQLGHMLVDEVGEIETDRSEWLKRQALLDQLYRADRDPLANPPWEGAAEYADPTSRKMVGIMHSRIMRSVMSQNPLVTPIPLREANIARSGLVSRFINWHLIMNANQGDGIEEFLDAWALMFCKNGTAIAKVFNDEVVRYVEETIEQDVPVTKTNPFTGQAVQTTKRVSKSFKGDKTIWKGARIEHINREDFLISPFAKSIDSAPLVAQKLYLSSDTLKRRADSGVYDAEQVTAVLKATPADGQNDVDGMPNGTGQSQLLQDISDESTGIRNRNGSYSKDIHEVLEIYRRYDLNEDGFEEEAVFWVHRASRRVLRKAYLEDVCKDRRRPFVDAHFSVQENQFFSAGICELIQSSQQEINFMRNQRVNHGTLVSTPAGFYEPGTGTQPEDLYIEPGLFLPATKVYPFNLPDHSAFGFQEELVLKQNIAEDMGIGDIQQGQVPSNSTFFRTASAPAMMIQEANIRFEVAIRRFQRAFRKLARKVYALTRKTAEPGMSIRVLGEGDDTHVLELTKENLSALDEHFDFDLRATADAAFPVLEREKAMQLLQLLQNPLLIQTGVVSLGNLYELVKNLLEKLGERNPHQYITKPPDYIAPPLPFAMAIGRIASGTHVEPSPLDDIEQNLAAAQEFIVSGQVEALSEVGIKLLEEYVAKSFKLKQQMDAAALVKQNPGLQGPAGGLGPGSPDSSANQYMAAQGGQQ